MNGRTQVSARAQRARKRTASGPQPAPSPLARLQRTAGNQAVAQLMALRAVQLQGLAGAEEDEFAAVAQGGAPVQRAATWAAGTVHQTNSLADVALGGAVVGITYPMLNGSTFVGGAAARPLIAAATVTTAQAGTPGAGAGSYAPPVFESRVDSVGTNTGSYDETVLSAGPWNRATTKAAVGAVHSGLAACTGAGNTSYRAKGSPDDAAMFAANRRHEDHHAADHKVAFEATVKSWDTKLTAAKAANRAYTGGSAAEAEAALWAAMGGTKDDVADAYWNQVSAKGGAFHGTPAGGPVSLVSTASAPDCATSESSWSNPG